MTQGGVTTTGLKEARAGVRALPRAVTLALRGVAWRTSRRVAEGARARLLAQTSGTGATAAAIRIVEDEARQQFRIESVAPVGKPANLPAWLEFGTRYMAARPYMGPALDAESAQYIRESEAASLNAAREALG